MSAIINEFAYDGAVKRRIIQNARQTFNKKPRANEVVSWIYSAKGKFAGSLCDSLENFGKLTENQFNAVLKIIDAPKIESPEIAAKKAASQHVGTIKARIELTLTCVYMSVEDGFYGLTAYCIFEDADKNTIIYSGSSWPCDDGETVTVKATVKAHIEKDGHKKTVIQRLKIVDSLN